VTLCDAGPLVALIDDADEHHARCASTLRQLPGPLLITTWACFAEAMYLLGRRGGFQPQDQLWSFVEGGAVALDVPVPGEWERMWELMEKYRDLPMDLADASLVTAAERLGVRRVFTVDGHFHTYRIKGKDAFQVIP
jgi:predicted nucleic acid-binding protein